MLNVLDMVTCGGMTIDAVIPAIVSTIVTAIKIFIPIVLIIFGMLDMGRAVLSSDEKAMKENQGKLIKRVIYAVVVFLIVALVQTVFGVLGKADTEGSNTATSCINCFINNECVSR